MKRFFETIDTLHRFTRELEYHQDKLQCLHCDKHDQFVSHGFVYKQRTSTQRARVGKRIYCSNREGRSGCGRTVRLYLVNEIPSLHYGSVALFIFISALLAHFTVKTAYQKATGQRETRHAWRWLNKLEHRLMDYRRFLSTCPDNIYAQFKPRTRRLQVLLPTLERLFAKFKETPCGHYQLVTQSNFI